MVSKTLYIPDSKMPTLETIGKALQLQEQYDKDAGRKETTVITDETRVTAAINYCLFSVGVPAAQEKLAGLILEVQLPSVKKKTTRKSK